MKTPFFALLLIGLSPSKPCLGDDAPPVTKAPVANLVKCIESMARGNVAAARVNVVNDVSHHLIRIFSVKAQEANARFNNGGYSVEVIYSPEVAAEAAVGVASYHYQHDDQILAFAAAQFASGNKSFSLFLVGLLAKAEPTLFWSSPSNQSIYVDRILSGLEKDDGSVKDFLQDQKAEWESAVKLCSAPQPEFQSK